MLIKYIPTQSITPNGVTRFKDSLNSIEDGAIFIATTW